MHSSKPWQRQAGHSRATEPPKLVQALRGRLLNRVDSVYQRGFDTILTCKNFPLPSHPTPHSPHWVVVIAELSLNHPAASSVLCTGYPSLIKICALFLRKGHASDPVEVDECQLLASQVCQEFGASNTMVEEGTESERFLSMLGAPTIPCSFSLKSVEQPSSSR
ncbi:hypothetical protein PtB15_3B556 [Puccinia triticina]|nr:hypothetical protein PtB15_3B556 [Puccinia triticina]